MERRYDAIVIGSGIGGLTGGAVLAQAGQRVLVIERNDNIGGAATVYRHGALNIEASLHQIDGLDDIDPKLPLIRSLGLDRAPRFVPSPEVYEVRGGPVGAPFVLPHGQTEALAASIARFPQHADALRRYFDGLAALRGAANFAAAHMDDGGWWLRHVPEAVERLWPVIRTGRATLTRVLHHLFGDDEAVKCALAADLPYYHDDPDEMPFLLYAVPQASYIAGGGHYVHGGSRALAEHLAELIRQAGGSIETGHTADLLLMDGDQAGGVRHVDRHGTAHVSFAPAILGNAAPDVLAGMLPEAPRAAFRHAYADRPTSISLWTVSVGLSAPARTFGVRHYSTFLLPDWMTALADYRHAASVMANPPGSRLPPFVLADYGQIDSGLGNGPPYLCTLVGVDRLDNWTGLSADEARARRAAWMDLLIARVDQAFPGFAAGVTQREMATAETMRLFLNTPGGAVYGFAPLALRGSARTPVPRLYLASAWAMGGGYTGAMLGGAAAARAALHDTRS